MADSRDNPWTFTMGDYIELIASRQLHLKRFVGETWCKLPAVSKHGVKIRTLKLKELLLAVDVSGTIGLYRDEARSVIPICSVCYQHLRSVVRHIESGEGRPTPTYENMIDNSKPLIYFNHQIHQADDNTLASARKLAENLMNTEPFATATIFVPHTTLKRPDLPIQEVKHKVK